MGGTCSETASGSIAHGQGFPEDKLVGEAGSPGLSLALPGTGVGLQASSGPLLVVTTSPVTLRST